MQARTSARPCWFVGATFDGTRDQTDRFLKAGNWENGYKDTYLDDVRSVRVGDLIAIKSSYTRKHGLPFDSRGHVASVMAVKAIGTVVHNPGDGRRLRVRWTKRFEKPREWYFFTNQKTIWKLTRQDWMANALIDFTFSGKRQDLRRFQNDPFWHKRFGTQPRPRRPAGHANTRTARVPLLMRPNVYLVIYHTKYYEWFRKGAKQGALRDASVPSSAQEGDIVIVYFSRPRGMVCGFGIIDSPPVPKPTADWKAPGRAWFCRLSPAFALTEPLSLRQLADRAGLKRWYSSRPNQTAHLLAPQVAHELLLVLRDREPRAPDEVWEGMPPHGPVEVERGITSRQEGAVKEITVEIRRRDPELRRDALAEYGNVCQVCDVDPALVYGRFGDRLAEVHHLKPISLARRTGRNATVKSVRVVCPNCHRALHRNGAVPVEIETLRLIVQANRRRSSL
ncbi:MAG: hypothetical protein K8T20_19590 [Planctomycetes bacterium]|nr:hypothetical protein [Planctomycetota bacterium]